MHTIGSFILALFVVIGSAAVFAIILASTLSQINTIIKKGSDPNMDEIPATILGALIGGVIGGGIAFNLSLSSTAGDVFTAMFGYAFVAVVLAFVAVTITKKVVHR